MFEHLHISHPATPPSWIDQWPSLDRIQSNFKMTIRQIGLTLATQMTSASAEWSDNRLRTRLAGHMQTWTRSQEDGSWTRVCTCGAPGACPHAYLVYLVLHKLFTEQGWLKNTTRQAPATRPVRPARPASQVPSAPRPATRSYFPGQDQQTAEHTLIVEADFKHEPGKVTLRFYDQTPAQRSLMNLMTVGNIGTRYMNNGTALGWSPEDQLFLGRILTEIKKIPWQNRNFNVLKLTPQLFQLYHEQWEGDESHFIDRISQQPLPRGKIETPTDFHVLLEPDDTQRHVTLTGVFTLPQGRSKSAVDYFTQLLKHPDAQNISQRLKRDFQPPLPWSVLHARFGLKNHLIEAGSLQHFLTENLEGHWELLRGSCVKTTARGKAEAFTVIAGIAQGNFYIEIRLVTGKVVDLQQPFCSSPTFTQREGKLAIVLPDNTLLCQLAKRILKLPGGTYAPATGRLTLSQLTPNATLLKELWQELAQQPVRLRPQPEVKLLLAPPEQHPALTPMVSVTDRRGPLATLHLEWSCGDLRFDTETLKRVARSDSSVPFRCGSSGWLELDPASAQQALQQLDDSDWLTMSDNCLLERHCSETVRSLQETLGAEVAPEARSYLERLAKEPPAEFPPIPEHLHDILRPYQRQGVDFLIDRAACHAGTILADDMGLGKTLQILSTLAAFRLEAERHRRPFQALVICPASVIPCWLDQAQQFCPELRVQAITGTPEQRSDTIQCSQADLLVTHYALARIDRAFLAQQNYDFLILDEAQAIKNPDAQVTTAVRSLQASHIIAMTGTPIENSLLDLWSIMSCVNPGLLDDRNAFRNRYNVQDGLAKLRRHIAPLIIRRSKNVVAQDLPERTEQLIMLDMEPEQREFYHRLLVLGKEQLRENGPGAILGLLTRLRQACCHTALINKDTSRPSVKLNRLLEQIVTLNAAGHSTLVFSQFASMLQLIAEQFQTHDIPHAILTGETPLATRQKIVSDFQNAPMPLNLLLSLKAAGTGLTLTKADYVFLLDPWWNPAAEQQAIDRTHRIGQRNPVVAYRYVTRGTVEENVLKLLQQKRELFNAILEPDENGDSFNSPAKLTMDDLRQLLD